MKNRFLIALALLATVSCQSDDTQDSMLGNGFLDGGEMTFSTSVSETRAGMTIDDLTNFGIYVYDSDDCRNENAKVSYDSNNGCTTEDAMTYPSWNEEVTITAYSPFSESTSTSFSVQSDQTTEAGVKDSDLLLACSAVTPSATPDTTNDIYYTQSTGVTTVQFDHAMAKFTLNLTLGTEWASASENPVSSVTIGGTKSDATIDFTDGSVAATGSATDISALCLSYADGNASLLSYEAILVPQTVDNLTVTVTMSDGMTIPYIIGATTLSGNENHTFALSIGTMPVDYITFHRNTSSVTNMTLDQDERVIASITSKFRRCLMYSDGTSGNATICYLDNSNSNYYNDGTTTADLTGAEGDVMVYFPEYWYKYEDVDTDYFRYYYSESEIDGGIHVPASLVGAYKAYNENSMVYSRSGVTPTRSVSQSNFISYASSRGTGYQIIDYNQHCVIAQIFYAKYLNRNSQAVLGVGGAEYNSNNTTGSTNSIGNADTSNETTGYVNGLGIEGVHGGISEFMQGVTISSSRVWTITNTDGDTRIVQAGTSSGYISAIAAESGEYFDMAPTAVISSTDSSYATTYYADYYWQSSSSSRCLARSNYSSDAYGGVAYAVASGNVSSTYLNIGSRLAFRGTITEATSVADYKALFN